MDSQIRANLAEWVLRRVVDPARASELVGDQLETQPGLGDVRFWLSIGWLVIVFSWRTVAGILAASIVGILLSWIPFAWALTRLWSIELRPAGPPPDGGPYIAISMLLWNAAIFFLIRFGMRSALTWIGLSWALLSTFAVCTFWIQNLNLSILVGTGALLLLFSGILRTGGLLSFCSQPWRAADSPCTRYSRSRSIPAPCLHLRAWRLSCFN